MLEPDYLNYTNAKTEVIIVCHIWPNHLNFSSNINSTDIKDCPMYVSYCFELEMPVNTHSGKPAATVSPILLQVNEP